MGKGIELSNEHACIKVYNLEGSMLHHVSAEIENKSQRIELNFDKRLPPGQYIIETATETYRFSRKIMVR